MGCAGPRGEERERAWGFALEGGIVVARRRVGQEFSVGWLHYLGETHGWLV
jgi:hypothetical protein